MLLFHTPTPAQIFAAMAANKKILLSLLSDKYPDPNDIIPLITIKYNQKVSPKDFLPFQTSSIKLPLLVDVVDEVLVDFS